MVISESHILNVCPKRTHPTIRWCQIQNSQDFRSGTRTRRVQRLDPSGVCEREREFVCVRACARALPGLLVRIQLVFGGHCSLYANQPSAPQEPSVLLRGQCRALRPRKHQRLSGKLLSNKPVIDLKIEEEEGGRISLEFLLDEERTLCGSLEVRCGKYAM